MTTVDAEYVYTATYEAWFSDRRQWATFAQFARSTGGNARTIDMLAINLWPSNQSIVVCEVKISRKDLLRELVDRSKYSVWDGIATERWYVTLAGVVKPGELPEGWGHATVATLAEGEDGAPVVRRVVQPTRSQPPATLPIELVQALARRSTDPAPVLPSWTWPLLSGRVVGAKELRRLTDRLYNRDLDRNRGETRRMSDWAFSLYGERDGSVHPGRLLAYLELQAHRPLRTTDAIAAYLATARGEGIARDPDAARILRSLADKLDPRQEPA